MRFVTVLRAGLVVTLLGAALPALAVEEPLMAFPVCGKDPGSQVPFVSFKMRRMAAVPAIRVSFILHRGSTVISTYGASFGPGGAIDASDTTGSTYPWSMQTMYPYFPDTSPTGSGGRLADGSYEASFGWYYDPSGTGALNSAGAIPLNVVNGFFTVGDVPPPNVPPAEATGKVMVRARHTGLAAAGYAVKVKGAGTAGVDLSGTTDSDGYFVTECKVGTFAVHCTGQFPGAPVVDSGVRTAATNIGQLTVLVFDFDDTGKDTRGSGGTPGADDPSSGSGGWLADILKSLFIPGSGHWDDLKAKAAGLMDFGPLHMIAEFWGTSGREASGPIALSLPLMTVNSSGVWSATGGDVPLSYAGLTSTPLWPTFRGMMGAGVWFGFVWYLTKKLTISFVT